MNNEMIYSAQYSASSRHKNKNKNENENEKIINKWIEVKEQRESLEVPLALYSKIVLSRCLLFRAASSGQLRLGCSAIYLYIYLYIYMFIGVYMLRDFILLKTQLIGLLIVLA